MVLKRLAVRPRKAAHPSKTAPNFQKETTNDKEARQTVWYRAA